MARNDDKLWLQQTLNRVAIIRAQEEIDRRGKSLPCHVVAVSGSIVTVAFDLIGVTMPQITIPKAENPYFRQPTQVGDLGITKACDVYLGGVSGLGGGTADTTIRGNLATLYFEPISNANSPPPTGYENYAVVQGPAGVFIQQIGGSATVVVDSTNILATLGSATMTLNSSEAQLAFGSTTITANSSTITLTAGGYTVSIAAGGLTINGIPFMGHTHSGVTTGSGDSGGVT